jgi:hypothetical protein
MSPAARSLQAFAFYLGAVAATLLLAPNVLLDAFGVPRTTEVWIRVAGMVVGFLALYDWVAARTEAVAIIRLSVLTRLAAPLFFLVFVTAGWVRWPLLLFGLVDLVTALWTWRLLAGSPQR